MTIENIKILGAILEPTALPIQPIWPIFKGNGLDWCGCLASSSKTSPIILILSIAIGADHSFEVKNVEICLAQGLHCTAIKLCCTIFLADCHTNAHLCVKQKFSAYLCPIILCWEKHARALPNCQKKCLFAHIVIKNKSTGRSALCQLDV